jgi:putative DNA primase/helicase
LVGIAGELATHYGITGWEKGEALEAAKVCFTDWLASRGGFGDVELDILRQLLPNFIGTHGSSRFIWWHRANDDHGANINNRAGFKRFLNKDGKAITSPTNFHQSYSGITNQDESEHGEVEYFILPEVFQQEICKGVDYRKVAKLYVDLGVIIPCVSGGKMQSATRTERLPTLGIARCYKIAPNFMSLTQH